MSICSLAKVLSIQGIVLLSKRYRDPLRKQLSSNENIQSGKSEFEKSRAGDLRAIDENKYVGFISKSGTFNAHRIDFCGDLRNDTIPPC